MPKLLYFLEICNCSCVRLKNDRKKGSIWRKKSTFKILLDMKTKFPAVVELKNRGVQFYRYIGILWFNPC